MFPSRVDPDDDGAQAREQFSRAERKRNDVARPGRMIAWKPRLGLDLRIECDRKWCARRERRWQRCGGAGQRTRVAFDRSAHAAGARLRRSRTRALM